MKLILALTFLSLATIYTGSFAYTHRVEIFLGLRELIPMEHIRWMADWFVELSPLMVAIIIFVIVADEWNN